MKKVSFVCLAAGFLVVLTSGCARREPPAPPSAAWTVQTSGTDASLRGVSAVDDRVAWASGSKGHRPQDRRRGIDLDRGPGPGRGDDGLPRHRGLRPGRRGRHGHRPPGQDLQDEGRRKDLDADLLRRLAGDLPGRARVLRREARTGGRRSDGRAVFPHRHGGRRGHVDALAAGLAAGRGGRARRPSPRPGRAWPSWGKTGSGSRQAGPFRASGDRRTAALIGRPFRPPCWRGSPRPADSRSRSSTSGRASPSAATTGRKRRLRGTRPSPATGDERGCPSASAGPAASGRPWLSSRALGRRSRSRSVHPVRTCPSIWERPGLRSPARRGSTRSRSPRRGGPPGRSAGTG